MKKIKSFGEFVNESNSEFSNYNHSTVLNENEGGILAYFTSAKNYAKAVREWEALYVQKKELEIEKENEKNALDIKKEEKLDGFDKKKPELIRKALGESEGAARKAKRTAIESKLVIVREKYAEKLQNVTDSVSAEYDREIGKVDTGISQIETDYPMENAAIKAKYNEYKGSQQAKLDLEYKQQLNQIQMDHKIKMDPNNEEGLAKLAAKQKEKLKEMKDEADANETRLKKKAADMQNKWQAELNSSDEKTKEAAQKFETYMNAFKEYVAIASEVKSLEDALEESSNTKGYSYDRLMEILDKAIESSGKNSKLMEADPATPATPATPAAPAKTAEQQKKEELQTKKADLTKKKSALNDAADKMTPKLFKTLGQSEDEAEQSAEDIKADVEDVIASFAKGTVVINKPKKGDMENIKADDNEIEETPAPAATSNTNTNTNNGGTPTPQNNSVDNSGYGKSVLSENKNVLSFEEFVNESRKNGFTF